MPFDSGEFIQSNPAFANPSTTTYNQAFVRQCYLSYLRREPENDGYNYWVNLLESRRVNRPGNISQDYDDMIGAFIFLSSTDCVSGQHDNGLAAANSSLAKWQQSIFGSGRRACICAWRLLLYGYAEYIHTSPVSVDVQFNVAAA
jgi:hypothetical protein